MGSFAYSLHVKSDDPGRVAATIGQLLAQDGWRAAKAPPAEQAGDADGASRRAFLVSAPVYGWVSILDSDLAGAYALAPQLAERLKTYSLMCFVNDSDSWSYALHRDDGLADEFDSAGDDTMADDLSEAELAEIGQSIQQLASKLSDGTFNREVLRMNDELLAGAPPEMREIFARIQQGQASREEVARFRTWEASEAPKHIERIQEFVYETLGAANISKAVKGGKSKKRKRKPTKAERAKALERADNLRPLFVADVTDERLAEVLSEKAVFAEETLAKFLPLVGIPAHYAYLSYDYHAESSPEELAPHGIQFAQRLDFETDS
jgi:hypothetical protein